MGRNEQSNVFRAIRDLLWTLEGMETLCGINTVSVLPTLPNHQMRNSADEVEQWSASSVGESPRSCTGGQVESHSFDGWGLQLLQQMDFWTSSG